MKKIKDKSLLIGATLFILVLLSFSFNVDSVFFFMLQSYILFASLFFLFIGIKRINFEKKLKNEVQKIKNRKSKFYTILKNYNTDEFGPIFNSDAEKESFYSTVEKISKRERKRYEAQGKLRNYLQKATVERKEQATIAMDESIRVLKDLIRNYNYNDKYEWIGIKSSFFDKQETFETNKLIDRAESFLSKIDSKSEEDKKTSIINAKLVIKQVLSIQPQNINRDIIKDFLAKIDAEYPQFVDTHDEIIMEDDGIVSPKKESQEQE